MLASSCRPPPPSRATIVLAGRHPALRAVRVRPPVPTATSRWSPTARGAACTSNASRATWPARSRSTSSRSAGCSRSCSSRCSSSRSPTSRSRRCSRSSSRSWSLGPIVYYPFSKTVWVAVDRGVPAAPRPERAPRRAPVAVSAAQTGLRSTRSVSTPSTNSQVRVADDARSPGSRAGPGRRTARARGRRPAAAAGRAPPRRGRGSGASIASTSSSSSAMAGIYPITAVAERRAPGRARRGRDAPRPRRTRGAPRASATAAAWCGASSQHQRPRRVEPVAAHASIELLDRLEPGRPAHQRAARLPVDDLGRQRRPRRRRRTAGSTRPRAARRAARPAARRTTTRRDADRAAGVPAPGDVRPRDRERVVAHVGGPHLGVGQLARERERDRTRAGAEVGDRVVRRARRPTGRSRPTRSPSRTTSSIASCATTSVSGRGISTRGSTSRSSPQKLHAPSTYCSGSPAARRVEQVVERIDRRGGWPVGRPRAPAPSPSCPTPLRRIQRASASGSSTPSGAEPRLGVRLAQLAPRSTAQDSPSPS